MGGRMKKRDIREGAWKTEGIDITIKRILTGQAVLSCLFLFLLLGFPSGALWWGIFFCLAECAVVYGGFSWLSGCVNRAPVSYTHLCIRICMMNVKR